MLGKQGVWLNLKTADGSGWVFSFNVRFQPVPSDGSARADSGAGRLFAPRHNVAVTSTIGIRGLEEEDLKQASFDADQMKLLNEYAASREAAEKRARAAGLSRASVEYLDRKK